MLVTRAAYARPCEGCKPRASPANSQAHAAHHAPRAACGQYGSQPSTPATHISHIPLPDTQITPLSHADLLASPQPHDAGQSSQNPSPSSNPDTDSSNAPPHCEKTNPSASPAHTGCTASREGFFLGRACFGAKSVVGKANANPKPNRISRVRNGSLRGRAEGWRRRCRAEARLEGWPRWGQPRTRWPGGRGVAPMASVALTSSRWSVGCPYDHLNLRSSELTKSFLKSVYPKNSR